MASTRDTSGRFCVALPFRSAVCGRTEPSVFRKGLIHGGSPADLGLSRSLALNRLYNLERRLAKDSDLYVAYRNFMKEYLTVGTCDLRRCLASILLHIML